MIGILGIVGLIYLLIMFFGNSLSGGVMSESRREEIFGDTDREYTRQNRLEFLNAEMYKRRFGGDYIIKNNSIYFTSEKWGIIDKKLSAVFGIINRGRHMQTEFEFTEEEIVKRNDEVFDTPLWEAWKWIEAEEKRCISKNQALYGTNTIRVGIDKKNIEIAERVINEYNSEPEGKKTADEETYNRTLKFKEAAEKDLTQCSDDVWTLSDKEPIYYPIEVNTYEMTELN